MPDLALERWMWHVGLWNRWCLYEVWPLIGVLDANRRPAVDRWTEALGPLELWLEHHCWGKTVADGMVERIVSLLKVIHFWMIESSYLWRLRYDFIVLSIPTNYRIKFVLKAPCGNISRLNYGIALPRASDPGSERRSSFLSDLSQLPWCSMVLQQHGSNWCKFSWLNWSISTRKYIVWTVKSNMRLNIIMLEQKKKRTSMYRLHLHN